MRGVTPRNRKETALAGVVTASGECEGPVGRDPTSLRGIGRSCAGDGMMMGIRERVAVGKFGVIGKDRQFDKK